MTLLRSRRRRIAPRAPGFTLIELMIALLLGLVVSGAAVALFITNRQTYVASESLARVQENARTAFELMARDVREAAGNACGAALGNTVNVLNTPSAKWYTDFSGGVRGYGSTEAFADAAFGTGAAQRVSGTDAIDLKSSFSSGVTVVPESGGNPAEIKLNTTDHDLNAGDIAMVCDSNQAAIFQVTNANPGTNVTVVHNTGDMVEPGNCTKGLGSPLLCTTNGNSYKFGCAFGDTIPAIPCTDPKNKWTAVVAKLKATRWYIGCNGRNKGTACDEAGEKSLYQSSLRNAAGTLTVDNDEITEGVDDMTLAYLSKDGTSYQPAGAVTDWSKVTAVRISLVMAGKERIGTDGKVLQRSLDHVVAIRNRAL